MYITCNGTCTNTNTHMFPCKDGAERLHQPQERVGQDRTLRTVARNGVEPISINPRVGWTLFFFLIICYSLYGLLDGLQGVGCTPSTPISILNGLMGVGCALASMSALTHTCCTYPHINLYPITCMKYDQ